jgi:two-component system, sensor histidine kinase PdtaS
LIRLGIPADRHGLGDLLAMLPVTAERSRLGDDADAVAEVLIYLVRKNLIEIPSAIEAGLNLQWGAHLCQIYRSQDELLELVVPFFRQGLRDHERCIWVVTPPLTPKAARGALEPALPDFGDQIAFQEHDDFRAPDAWRQAEERALDQGYLGLRVAGDTRLLGAIAGGLRIKALCTYSAERFRIGDAEMLLPNHDAAYVKQRDCWARIPASGPRWAETILASLSP